MEHRWIQTMIKTKKKIGSAGRKKWAAAAAVLLAGGLLAGCGQPKGATTAQKEFVFVPEYVKVEVDDYLEQTKILGDTMYFVSGGWDDATETYQQYFGKLKLGEKVPEKVAIELSDEESMMAENIDGNGNLQAIVMTALYDDENSEGAGSLEETGNPEEMGDIDKEAQEEESSTDNTAKDEKEAEENGKEEGAEEAGEGTEAAEENGEEGEEASSRVITSGTTGVISSHVITSGTAVAEVSFDGDMEYREPTGRKIELWKIGADGKVAEKLSLDRIWEDSEDSYIQYLVNDKEGNIYIGYDQNFVVLDKTGEKLFDFQVDNWIDTMFSTADGQVLVSYWGENGMEVHTIDTAAKKVGDKIDALSSGHFGNGTYAQGTNTDLLFSVGGRLYSYNFGDAEAQELLDWIGCDIDESDIQSFTMLEDGRILVITTNWDGETDASQMELVYLTKKKGSEVPEKKILTYGTLMMNYDVRKRILEFNRTNQEYHIEVREYYTGYDGSYMDATQQMNSDIVSGNCPDIIDISDGNVQSYIAKGVVADLYPFMDKDEEINRGDYLENILKAYEKNGKLYALPSEFFISTMMAKVSDVGDKQRITLDEVMELAQNIPEGAELYEYASNINVLSNILQMNMDVFVNWETGECKFNSDEFIKALEFANTFPKEYNWDADRPSTPTRIREGQLIMMNVSISSMQEYQMYKGMYGEPTTFIGYPTSKECGSFIISNGSLLAISAKSPYQDGAWQFVRANLTKEAQEDNKHYRNGFPVMKSALEKQFAEDMEDEYYEGPNGEKEKQPKTTWGYDDFQIEIYAATQEEVDVVRNLIESVDSVFQSDVQILIIIGEEVEAYFEGQKSAKDVADIIQSRVQIYVNENR